VLLFNYSNLVDPVLKDVRTYVAGIAGMKAGDRVLDVCCGTGEQVFRYMEKGASATGIDHNPDIIKVAEKNRQRRGFDDGTFYLASATQLPFPDSYFDCVSISLGLHEIERDERYRAVSEMKRVVKKEGVLLFIDFQVPLPKNCISYIIKTIEFLAGRNNYRYFTDYLAQGGLSQILKETQLTPQKEALLKFGNLKILKVSNT
jgi:ubiquinone/menaquinone biosynthesis C-methylase UbiE